MTVGGVGDRPAGIDSGFRRNDGNFPRNDVGCDRTLWIPAFAGMTVGGAGMTVGGAVGENWDLLDYVTVGGV